MIATIKSVDIEMAQPNLSTILVVKYLVIALYTSRKPKPNKAINNENEKQTHTGISDYVGT